MGRKITKTALKRLHRRLGPLTQFDLFVDRELVSRQALDQLRDADHQVKEAGIRLWPTKRRQ
jgi:hypothetical protein